jgi:CRISPR/Cas system-associated exonuclease Cas4 (RecB family)
LLTYKASRKTVPATGANISPIQEFEQLFNFSAIEQKLSPAFLGLTQPVTPDFLYADRIIGDIKTGKFDEDTFLMTCAAYALAFEAEYRRNIDFGVILHIEFSSKHPFPIYQGSRLYEIDDGVRRKFTILRDQKLDVLVKRIEPPVQQDEPRCRLCRFYSKCWEKPKDA